MPGNFPSNAWFPSRIPALESFKPDLQEDDAGYTIEAEVPCAKKDNITPNLEQGRLTTGVAGKQETGKKQKRGATRNAATPIWRVVSTSRMPWNMARRPTRVMAS